MQTLEEVNKVDGGAPVALPNPVLFIIVNSKSKSNKMVWQSLINVGSLKGALRKLREINWLYANIDENSHDDAFSETTSTMLQKVSSEDVASYQSYTIRRLDQKESSIPDADQYKLTNIKEDALSNKLKYLDVLCFPTLLVVDLVSPIHMIFIFHLVRLSSLVFSTRTGDIVRTTSTYSICYGRRRCVASSSSI